jgi:hypothetical protein
MQNSNFINRTLEWLYSKKFIAILTIVFFIFFLFGLIVLVLYFVKFHSGLSTEHADWGTFGDLFGGLFGPILTLAAFLAALIAISVQADELKKQSIEREMDTFNNSFFNLLNAHLETITNFRYYDRHTNEPFQGRAFFTHSVNRIRLHIFEKVKKLYLDFLIQDINRIDDDFLAIFWIGRNLTLDSFFTVNREVKVARYSSLKALQSPPVDIKKQLISLLADEPQKPKEDFLAAILNNKYYEQSGEHISDCIIKHYYTFPIENRFMLHANAYKEFYDIFGAEAGYYFRILNNILRFIDDKCPVKTDKKRFAKLIRAQLSRHEIALLYYNCLSEMTSANFNRLISQKVFNMLKGIYNLDLFDIHDYLQLLDIKNDRLNRGIND